MRTCRAATLGLFVACPLAAQTSAPAGTVVPITYEDARVYVPVRIGRDSLRWYILDSGSQPTILDTETARRVDLAVREGGTVTGAGAGSLREGHARQVTLNVGGVPLGPTDVAVAPLDALLAPYTGHEAAGVIGSRFFREHAVELDFARDAMTVRDPSAIGNSGEGLVVPFRLQGDIPVVTARLTTATGQVLAVRLVVDLGAKATLLLTEPFIKRHALATQFGRSVESALGAGVGGETHYAFVRAPRLALDGPQPVVADSIVVGLSVRGTLRDDWCDGLLGAEFLHRYHVTFDYAHQRMMLLPREPARSPAEFDMSGMYLMASQADHHRFVVHELVPGGPAAAAGIQVGDVVMAIDGRRAAQMTLSAVRDLLRSRDGGAVALELDRQGTQAQLTVRLRRLI